MAFTSDIYADQQVVTASAVALAASGQLKSGLVIKAKSSNAGKVFIGGASVTATDDGTGNGFALNPGETLTLPINLAAAAYVIGTANDIVYVVGA
jgi:hypothetical protein